MVSVFHFQPGHALFAIGQWESDAIDTLCRTRTVNGVLTELYSGGEIWFAYSAMHEAMSGAVVFALEGNPNLEGTRSDAAPPHLCKFFADLRTCTSTLVALGLWEDIRELNRMYRKLCRFLRQPGLEKLTSR